MRNLLSFALSLIVFAMGATLHAASITKDSTWGYGHSSFQVGNSSFSFNANGPVNPVFHDFYSINTSRYRASTSWDASEVYLANSVSLSAGASQSVIPSSPADVSSFVQTYAYTSFYVNNAPTASLVLNSTEGTGWYYLVTSAGVYYDNFIGSVVLNNLLIGDGYGELQIGTYAGSSSPGLITANATGTLTLHAVPEPMTMISFLGMGIGSVLALRRKKQNRSATL